MDGNDGAWFRQKKFGYGAGWPIAWQGWAVLGIYVVIAMIAGLMWESQAGLMWESQDEVYRIAAAILFVLATLVLIFVSRAKTRGGWHWRP